MGLEFQIVHYDRSTFLEQSLPEIPKSTAVYKIFDSRGKLIVLDKTSNLSHRLERFFGPHSELVKDLDLRQIAGRIEFARTFSPFETTYALYLERREYFPKSYRRMKTFRYFTLMKFNRRQRFPRVYASRQIKAGVDYFGPFASHAQFTRMKTAVERAFKLRPCLFNIRGNDPHPDCIYFQMHTCSRPCNNDIGRSGYLLDVERAMAFVEGNDEIVAQPWIEEMTALAAEMKFEEAETVRRRVERLQRTRQEHQNLRNAFTNLSRFDYVIVLPSDSVSRRRIAVVRGGAIVGFESHSTSSLGESLTGELERCFNSIAVPTNREWLYDEFCLVCTFLEKKLKNMHCFPHRDIPQTLAEVQKVCE